MHATDVGPNTPFVTWGEFVTNLLMTRPELTGKVSVHISAEF